MSIAGSLFIAQFPAFLYYSEFIGILLLCLGFFDYKSLRKLKKQEEGLPPKVEIKNPPGG